MPVLACVTNREDVALRRATGLGHQAVARELDRSPSTISRELRRSAATRRPAGGRRPGGARPWGRRPDHRVGKLRDRHVGGTHRSSHDVWWVCHALRPTARPRPKTDPRSRATEPSPCRTLHHDDGTSSSRSRRGSPFTSLTLTRPGRAPRTRSPTACCGRWTAPDLAAVQDDTGPLDECLKAQVTRVELRGLEPLTPTLPVRAETGRERAGTFAFAGCGGTSALAAVSGRWRTGAGCTQIAHTRGHQVCHRLTPTPAAC